MHQSPGLVRGVEVECRLTGIAKFCLAGLDQSSEVFRRVGRTEVFDDSIFPLGLVRDLHSRGTRRRGHLAHEWADSPMIRVRLVTQFRAYQPCDQHQCFPNGTKRPSPVQLRTTYVGDITYLPYGTEGKFLYLATVIDVCSKRFVGWSIADHMRTSLVEGTMYSAVNARETPKDTIFHSDHGRQYTSSAFQAKCRRLGVVQSMGRIGSSADNALEESENAALKRETLQGAKRWDTAAQYPREVFRWLIRYNSRRRQSVLGYRAPNDFEFDRASKMDLNA